LQLLLPLHPRMQLSPLLPLLPLLLLPLLVLLLHQVPLGPVALDHLQLAPRHLPHPLLALRCEQGRTTDQTAKCIPSTVAGLQAPGYTQRGMPAGNPCDRT